MAYRTILIGILLALAVFTYGYVMELATIRMLIIRSVLSALGIISAIFVARKGIETIVEPSETASPPMDEVNLDEAIEQERSEEEDQAQTTSDDIEQVEQSDPMEAVESVDSSVDSEQLQEELEKQVEEGNEEGVQEIADLISDSMNS